MFKIVNICLIVFFSLSFFTWAEQAISPSQEKEILKFISEEYPKEYYKEIMILKEKDLDLYQQRLNYYKREKESYEELKNNYPEVFERLRAKKRM